MTNEKQKIGQKITDAVRKGKWAKALEGYEQLIKLSPRELTLSIRKAECLEKLGRTDDALNELRRVSQEYMKRGFTVQAISIAKRVLTLDPGDTVANQTIVELQQEKVARAPMRGITPTPDKLPESTARRVITTEPSSSARSDAAPPQQGSSASPNVDIELDVEGLLEGGVDIDRPPERTPFFDDLRPDEMATVLKLCAPRRVSAGQWICRENDVGDSICVIAHGQVEISCTGSEGPVTIGQLGPGEFFGEFGFFIDRKRHASVRALIETELLELSRDDIQKLIDEHARVGDVLQLFFIERVVDMLLARSRFFGLFTPTERGLIKSKLVREKVKDGDFMIREGERGDTMYLIQSGHVVVTTKKGDFQVELARLNPGEFFGEIGALTGQLRTASCRAKGDVEILALGKADLHPLLQRNRSAADVLRRIADEHGKGKADTLFEIDRWGMV